MFATVFVRYVSRVVRTADVEAVRKDCLSGMPGFAIEVSREAVLWHRDGSHDLDKKDPVKERLEVSAIANNSRRRRGKEERRGAFSLGAKCGFV